MIFSEGGNFSDSGLQKTIYFYFFNQIDQYLQQQRWDLAKITSRDWDMVDLSFLCLWIEQDHFAKADIRIFGLQENLITWWSLLTTTKHAISSQPLYQTVSR